MKRKAFGTVAVLSVAAIIIATVFCLVLRANGHAVPFGATKFQEKDGVTLYTYHNGKAAYENQLETNNSAYVVDGGRVLDVINLKYDEQVAVVSVYKNRIVLLSYRGDWRETQVADNDRLTHTNGAMMYVISRSDGAMQFVDFQDHTGYGGRFVAAAPDGSYLLFSSVVSEGEGDPLRYHPHIVMWNLENFWNRFEYGFADQTLGPGPGEEAEDLISDVSVSPDGAHAAVVVEEPAVSTQKTTKANLYFLDLTKSPTDAPAKAAELIVPTDQMWAHINALGYDGVATEFVGSIAGWDSPTSVRVMTSPAQMQTFQVQ